MTKSSASVWIIVAIKLLRMRLRVFMCVLKVNVSDSGIFMI